MGLYTAESLVMVSGCAGNPVRGSTELHCPYCDHVLPGLLLCGESGLPCPQVGCCTKLQVIGKVSNVVLSILCVLPGRHFKSMLDTHVSTILRISA